MKCMLRIIDDHFWMGNTNCEELKLYLMKAVLRKIIDGLLRCDTDIHQVKDRRMRYHLVRYFSQNHSLYLKLYKQIPPKDISLCSTVKSKQLRFLFKKKQKEDLNGLQYNEAYGGIAMYLSQKIGELDNMMKLWVLFIVPHVNSEKKL